MLVNRFIQLRLFDNIKSMIYQYMYIHFFAWCLAEVHTAFHPVCCFCLLCFILLFSVYCVVYCVSSLYTEMEPDNQENGRHELCHSSVH